jgi:hypothetical protein
MIARIVVGSVAAFAGLATPISQAGAQPSAQKAAAVDASQGCKADLEPATLAKLHELIRPHPQEWRHLQVQWLTDVVAARKKAAAEDKPIVICYTGGAGYNEPLGVC